MTIIISLVLIFALQIYLLVKSIKTPTKTNWSLLFKTEMLSVAFVVAFAGLMITTTFINWDSLTYLIIDIMAGALYLLMLIISLIIKAIKSRKIAMIDSENQKSEKVSSTSKTKKIIFVAFLTAISIVIIPYPIKQKTDKDSYNEARDQIISLLNEKYGDGNFKIVSVEEKNVNYRSSWMWKIYGYEFTISTDYMDKNFAISLEKEDFKIHFDDFLEDYYRETAGITDLEEYISDKKIEQLSKDLSQRFNAKIKFSNRITHIPLDKSFGKIPTIDELSEFVTLEEPKIEINDDLKTEEELLDYLIELSDYFINDFDKSNIDYTRGIKYFRYKYDYAKLGVFDYTDQYSGYGGYVAAGRNIYSEEEGKYIVEDEDSILRINILGKVTELNISE